VSGNSNPGPTSVLEKSTQLRRMSPIDFNFSSIPYGKDSVLLKIRNFYEKTGRVPVSKDYRDNYKGNGLPHWQTIKKHFPNVPYDEVIHQALGVETFEELLSNYIKENEHQNVLFIKSPDVLTDGYWASPIRYSGWLTSKTGTVIDGYHLELYASGPRERGYLYKLTKINSNAVYAEVC